MFFLSSLNVYTYMYVFIISTLHFETGKSKIAPFCLLLQHALLCYAVPHAHRINKYVERFDTNVLKDLLTCMYLPHLGIRVLG